MRGCSHRIPGGEGGPLPPASTQHLGVQGVWNHQEKGATVKGGTWGEDGGPWSGGRNQDRRESDPFGPPASASAWRRRDLEREKVTSGEGRSGTWYCGSRRRTGAGGTPVLLTLSPGSECAVGRLEELPGSLQGAHPLRLRGERLRLRLLQLQVSKTFCCSQTLLLLLLLLLQLPGSLARLRPLPCSAGAAEPPPLLPEGDSDALPAAPSLPRARASSRTALSSPGRRQRKGSWKPSAGRLVKSLAQP